MRSTIAAVLMVLIAAPAPASVCEITLPPHGPVDSTPDPERLAAARALLVRRDAFGAPSATGLKCILNVGMSTADDYGTATRALIKTLWKPLMASGVRYVNAAQSGRTVRFWDERGDEKWAQAIVKLSHAGCTPLQVVLVTSMVTQEQPATLGAMTAGEVAGVIDAAHFHFPNAVHVIGGHTFTGYLDPAFADKVPEPYIYQDTVTILGEVSLPQLYPVIFRDRWSRGHEANPVTGLTWFCSDVRPDGHHPIPGIAPDASHPDGTGARKLGTLDLRWWQAVFAYDAATDAGLVKP